MFVFCDVKRWLLLPVDFPCFSAWTGPDDAESSHLSPWTSCCGTGVPDMSLNYYCSSDLRRALFCFCDAASHVTHFHEPVTTGRSKFLELC